METLECIKTRRSVRKFEDREVPAEVIRQIAEAAVMAPSWKNTQVVRWNIVKDPAKKQEIAESAVLGFAYNTKTIDRAPVIAVQSVVTGISGMEKDGTATTDHGENWEMYDAGLAAENFCLAAHDLGVGTVIMGIIDDVKAREILDLPEKEMVTAVIAMGYPLSDKNGCADRKEYDQIVRVF